MAEPTTAASAAPAQIADFAKQEIRLATVLNGGVSLAVWMSGVTLEFHHLAMASAGCGRWDTYARVLDALGATARVDVIAGTSAGGLNGAFLALGLNRKRDFTGLRDVWAEAGALESLLRRPLTKNPPSALAGDGYFLPKISSALHDMTTEWDRLQPTDPVPGVDLILTGTLWSGRQTRFADDMGVGITERDYNATFRFTSRPVAGATDRHVGDLTKPERGGDPVLDELASAARCTSSFPAAFEPHYVSIPDRGAAASAQPGRWPSSAGQANFDTSQYVLDGGILLNKPLRPALDAIYNQTAQNQVRRVLCYVVPDPGEPPRTPATDEVQSEKRPPVPVATDVLLGVLTRLTSTDSVSRELAQIRDTNARVRSHRRARGRLSLVMATAASTMVPDLWPGYRAERINSASRTIAALIAEGESTRIADGEDASQRWSVQELVAALREVAARPPGFGFVPAQTDAADALALTGEQWSWGQTTLVRLSDIMIDLMKRAVLVAPLNSPEQQTIVEKRGEVRDTLHHIAFYTRDLEQFWTIAGPTAIPLPPRRLFEGAESGSAANTDELVGQLAKLVNAWDTVFGNDKGEKRREKQYEGATTLAQAMLDLRPTLVGLVTPRGEGTDDQQILSALVTWLLPAGADAQTVLTRMLQLDVVVVATSGALDSPEQEVDLVQLSCADRDRVTGMQLHHFGAFYRRPWRVNDWIEGRMDGTRQIVRLLLDPARFRQRGYTTDQLLDTLHGVAVPDGRDTAWLEQRWQQRLTECRREIDDALGTNAPTTSLDLASEAACMPLRLEALREDLPAVAAAVRSEGHDVMAGSAQWLANYEAALARQGPAHEDETEAQNLTADQLWTLRSKLDSIGTQKITDDIGSDTFARTTSHAAVVTTGAFSSKTKLAQVKPVRAVVSALRGYVAMVYAMVAYLSAGSRIGPQIVGITAAAGGALLAVTIFVPSVPIGLTLAGVILLFAAASAAALRTRDIRTMGLRLLLVTLLFAAVFGWLVYRDVHDHGFHGEVVSTVIKIAIGLGVVLIGFFIANGGRHRDKF